MKLNIYILVISFKLLLKICLSFCTWNCKIPQFSLININPLWKIICDSFQGEIESRELNYCLIKWQKWNVSVREKLFQCVNPELSKVSGLIKLGNNSCVLKTKSNDIDTVLNDLKNNLGDNVEVKERKIRE